ncbi:MAG: restriction endonuclease subunit S [Fibrobacteria bacterium]|nr:restriction endonuclease subunit S [Fibrobacteria bacterium]
MVVHKLSQVASVQVGNTFRTGLEPNPVGDTFVFQMRDVADLEFVDPAGLTQIVFGPVRDTHLLLPGDLVFRSRGTKVSTALVPDLPMPALVAAPLFRIRPTTEQILPRYLNWFINTVGQSHLGSRAEGSDLKMVSIQSVKDLEVTVPSLSRQLEIVELAALAREEARLTESIVQLRSKLVTSCLARALQET